MRTAYHAGKVVLAVGCLVSSFIATEARCQSKSELGAKIAAYMVPIQNINGFTGYVMVAKGGKVLFKQGYGFANFELKVPNTEHTKFHLASISKTFTGTAIMLLEESGKLSVDDPLSKYIPDYPGGDRIKLSHLLTNTSGIPNINNFPEYSEWAKSQHTTLELIAKFKDKPLDFEPGTKGYTESNSNYNLLAYIIEQVSGESYGTFVKRHICDPLGMSETGHDGNPQELLMNRASGYMPVGALDFENAPYMNWSVKTGNGSIYSTASDLHKWDRSFYTEKLLKRRTIERMIRNHFGWFETEERGRRMVYMNGRQPGFQCEIRRYVNDDVLILVLGNSYITTPSLMVADFASMVFGEPYSVPRIGKPVPVAATTLDRFVGRYKFGSDFIYAPGVVSVIERRGGDLFSTGRGPNLLIPQSETTFFDKSVWAMITFVPDQEGKIDRFIWRYGDKEFTAMKLKDEPSR